MVIVGSFAQGAVSGRGSGTPFSSIAKRDSDRRGYAAKQQQRRNTRNAKGGKHGFGQRSDIRTGYGA